MKREQQKERRERLRDIVGRNFAAMTSQQIAESSGIGHQAIRNLMRANGSTMSVKNMDALERWIEQRIPVEPQIQGADTAEYLRGFRAGLVSILNVIDDPRRDDVGKIFAVAEFIIKSHEAFAQQRTRGKQRPEI